MRIWLPKPIYELIPYSYVFTGFLALVASMYLNSWYWPNICLVIGFALLIAGLTIGLKRRDYRQNRRPPGIEDIE